ncbi:unnamed protein product [Allacma fusca]|uniref:Sodefrin-like factor n=1 Tax=Allacma fusca TaxID=39272 RepID=A0A8J2P387_9HEXA|nr:unnamed protein product [Allacma fusca]
MTTPTTESILGAWFALFLILLFYSPGPSLQIKCQNCTNHVAGKQCSLIDNITGTVTFLPQTAVDCGSLLTQCYTYFVDNYVEEKGCTHNKPLVCDSQLTYNDLLCVCEDDECNKNNNYTRSRGDHLTLTVATTVTPIIIIVTFLLHF